MNRLLPYIIYVWCLFVAAAVRAQDNMSERCFSVNDGLSQGIVQDIIQDRNGYIWFSTWNGLNKYDGYVFTSFKSHPGVNYTSGGGSRVVQQPFRGAEGERVG